MQQSQRSHPRRSCSDCHQVCHLHFLYIGFASLVVLEIRLLHIVMHSKLGVSVSWENTFSKQLLCQVMTDPFSYVVLGYCGASIIAQRCLDGLLEKISRVHRVAQCMICLSNI